MRIDLASLPSRFAFLSVLLALAGTLAFAAGKLWLAERWAGTSDPGLWRKAACLEPANADYWRDLGIHEQWSLGPAGKREAIRDLLRATQRNPHSAGLWMDLADAYQASGNTAAAERAYRIAPALYPVSSEVAWRYGSFLLYAQDLREGYAQIRRALLADPSLENNALLECWQENPDVNSLLEKVLPPQSPYYVTAMDFFLVRRLLDPALAVWKGQLALKQPVEMAQGVRLIDALIAADRLVDAQQTWSQALAAAHWPQVPGSAGSLVFNGGFEHDSANGAFDWRAMPLDGAHITFDTAVAHSGSRSFQITFDGGMNLDFQNLFQIIPIRPGGRYRFSAFLRTQEISTDQGIRFEISDWHDPARLRLLTQNMTGTSPWTQVQAEFTAGANTRLLQIALRRIPSGKFDNKIRGTAWVDDVSLIPLPPSAGSRP